MSRPTRVFGVRDAYGIVFGIWGGASSSQRKELERCGITADHVERRSLAITRRRGQAGCRVPPTDFVPPDFAVPNEVTFGDLKLVPLGPEHNTADYAAWTSSIDHIRATPGFPDGSWPALMSVSDNLRDLERHAGDFRLRRGFTYTVLDANGEVIGCLYIYPSKDEHVDAQVLSWVRADRSDLDRPLYEAVRAWLRSDWPFGAVQYDERVAD